MSARPQTIITHCSTIESRLSSHRCTPTASAAMPMHAVNAIHTTAAQEPSGGAFSSNPTPAGSSTKMKGTTKAGSVYFQACIVVLYGSPPVIAAAANGDSAVGGETSDNTA